MSALTFAAGSSPAAGAAAAAAAVAVAVADVAAPSASAVAAVVIPTVKASDGVDVIVAAMRGFAGAADVQRQAGQAIEQLTEEDEDMRVRCSGKRG